MLDIKLFRDNPQLIKDNLVKKFQEHKLSLVDEIVTKDERYRKIKTEADALRGDKNKLSKQIGQLMAQKEIEKATEVKAEVARIAEKLSALEAEEPILLADINQLVKQIPNIIDESVPIGKDDSENVVISKHGTIRNFDFEIPHHVDIMESFCGIDLDSSRKTSGTGFYYLLGDVARLHSAVLAYARDFMINKGFIYAIPPFMIRGNVVEGVMSFSEMENMMYKIENEDLYLIGTSEHSMIGRFIDTILKPEDLPITLTSYSPSFRKEVGAHGIDERGIYRVHQFEKQEMIVICQPEDSKNWFEKMKNFSVELFDSLDIPIQVIECCSGDLADLKSKSVDIEAYSPRQKKYFEVCSCSNLTDAQARRLQIRIDGGSQKTFAHTLNNTVIASPRMLIAYLENHLQKDGSVKVVDVLKPYMGMLDYIKCHE